MRILIFLGLFILTSFITLNAQVKIGANPQNIDPSSILELEDNSRALVITRLNDVQMANMSPLRGALVFNTDQDCVFYFNGTTWENLCADNNTTNISLELQESELTLTDSDGNTVTVELGSAIGQSFSADPIVNFRETIIITQNGENYNFEVGLITGDNIVDSSINGIDLQDNSITDDKLAPNSVGQDELQDNAVADAEIDYSQVTVGDFNNDAGYITSAQIVSPNPNNVIIDDDGAFYDDSVIRNDIATNTTNLANHITADQDLNPDNELVIDLELNAANELVLDQQGGSITVPLGSLNNPGTDEQDISTNGDPGNISIDNGSEITLNVNDGDFNDQNEIQDADEVDINPITGIVGSTVQLALEELQVDVDALNAGGGNTDEQDISTNGDPGNIGIDNGSEITLNVNDGDFDNQNEIQDADEVDIAPIAGIVGDNVQLALEELQTDVDGLVAGGGADGVITNVSTSGNDLVFAGNAPGFVGNVAIDTDPNNELQIITSPDNSVTVNPVGNNYELTVAGGTGEVNDGTFIGTGESIFSGKNGLNLEFKGISSASNKLSIVDNGSDLNIDINDANLVIENTNILNTNGANGQYLRIDPGTGNVVWDDLPTGTGGAVSTDGVTITGDGVATDLQIVNEGVNTLQLAPNAVTTVKILDDNVTIEKIAAGSNGEVLTTNLTGDVVWAAPTAGAVNTDGTTITGDGVATPLSVGTINDANIADVAFGKLTGVPADIADGDDTGILTVNTDGTTITGDGVAIPLSVGTITDTELAADAVTTVKILNDNVTPAKIEPGSSDGEVLTTIGTDVVWAAGTTMSSTDNSILIAQTGSNFDVEVLEVQGSLLGGGNPSVIVANSIGTDDIGVDAVGQSEIGTGGVASDEIEDDSIVDADINSAAAIDGTKIDPNFGNQNVLTTGDFIDNGVIIVAPDFVFQKYFTGYSELKNDYEFKSLTEIEEFVKANNHLPGVRSAYEIRESGEYRLSESSLIHLEKIEELFLHTIEQEKKIELLKEENKNLAHEVESLRKDMELIKALLIQKETGDHE